MSEQIKNRSSDVKLINIVKNFPKHDGKGLVKAVDHINLEIENGELVTLLGPSGCGKTTTLRMIAGFDFPTSGQIQIANEDVANVPPNKRDISMVFQNYALFPHMTIYDNIAYGLGIKKRPKNEIKQRTDNVIKKMQLVGMEDRNPGQLSGGQQQRVALARAIVIEPRLLLFDEPLSNLDANLRETMREELRKLQQDLNITSLYVTHDQAEAMAISDKIVIMKDGIIVQAGTPQQIYENPNSCFVANFMGKANFIPTEIISVDKDAIEIQAGTRQMKIKVGDSSGFSGQKECLMVVRPESISLSKDPGLYSGTIQRITYFGHMVEYKVTTLNQSLLVQIYNPLYNDMFGINETVGWAFILNKINCICCLLLRM